MTQTGSNSGESLARMAVSRFPTAWSSLDEDDEDYDVDDGGGNDCGGGGGGDDCGGGGGGDGADVDIAWLRPIGGRAFLPGVEVALLKIC